MRTARVFFAGRDEPEDVSGADVVVVDAAASDAWGEVVRDRAPNSVVLVVGDSPQTMCETTLFPRARIIGVEAEDVNAVIEAIVNDRGVEFQTIVRCQGERGLEDEFARVPVRIGARGVIEIVD